MVTRNLLFCPMAIGDIFKKPDNQNMGPASVSGIEHFWSLVIGKNWVQAGIWRVLDETTQIISEGNMASWQEGDEDSLVTASDSTLSAAATSMTGDVPEPDKVVFGLQSCWVEEGSIKDERMGLLKKISQELELSPAGFVVVPEAIAHLWKVREGSPLNALLVGISDDAVEVSISQSGKILGTVDVARSMSLGTDVAEGLSRLPSVSSIPTRILLYNHKVGNLGEARQNLINMEWDAAEIHFLHTPKVELLPENTALLAVSLAGGAEVGSAKDVVFGKTLTDFERAKMDESLQEVESADVAEIPSDAESLGFSSADAAQSKLDVDASSISNRESVSNIEDQIEDEELEEPPVQQPISAREDHMIGDALASKPNIFGAFGHVASGAGSFLGPVKSGFSVKGKGPAFLALFAAILIFGGIGYWYLPKATVVVYVSPKKLAREIEFSVDPKIRVVDQANRLVPGASKEEGTSGDKTTSTTGTKTVGERAKGKVTILHVGGATTIKAGATLSGPNGLKFTLDEDVKIASGSGITTPAEAQAPVSAADIGAQYNLASSAKFGVGNFSRDTFEATNKEAFTGGTSRSVSAVSEEDQADLLADLTEELTSWGLESIKGKLQENEVLIANSGQFRALEKKFSHKPGDETQTLKLTLSGRVTALVLQKDVLNSLVRANLDSGVPSGYTLRQDQIEMSFRQSEVKQSASTKEKKKVAGASVEGKANSFVASVNANLLPQVDPEEVKRQILGKTPTAAREHLSAIPGFTRAEISLRPKFPGPLGTLPRVSKNIVVEVAAER